MPFSLEHALLRRSLFAGTAMACAMGGPAITLAAESDSGLEEVVVTATKRAVDLQKTSAAISVIGTDFLEKSGISDVSQLTKLVPSLIIGRQGTNAVVYLRGVGQSNSTPNAQPGVSLNMDGVYLSRVAGGLAMFDLERVEVLPGPQGTLYGRNSTGGAVNLVTHKPGNEFGGEGFVEAGNYSTTHVFAAADLPIVSDKFALRAAVDYNKHDGYLSNGANDADSVAGRLSAHFAPSDSLSADIQYTRINGNGLGMQMINKGTANPPFGSRNDPWSDSFSTTHLFTRDRGDLLMGNITFNLNDNLALSYLPGYVDYNSEQGLQFGTAYNHFAIQSAKESSHELRLTSDGDGRFKWLVGLFYFYSAEAINALVDPFQQGAGPAIVDVFYDNHSKSSAVFGEGTYSITDSFRLTLGGRYSSDRYRGDGHNFLMIPVQFGGHSDHFAGEDTKDRADYKVGVEYDLTPQSMAYATVQSGYLVGGYTAADINSSFPKSFKQEELTAYVAGVKNRFLDNRLQINNEIFYYDYRDYQLQAVTQDQITGATAFNIISVPKAVIYGNQLDTVLSLGSNTDINLSVAYLSASITRGIPGPFSYKDYDLPGSPEWTINAGLDQRFPLSNGGLVRFHVSSIYSSAYWNVFTQDVNSRQEGYTKTDVTLTYESPGGRWNVGVYGRNLEDQAVYYGATSTSIAGEPGVGPQPTFIDVPRTYGARVGLKF